MRLRGGVTTEYRVAGPNQSYTRVEVDPSDRKDNGGMYCPTVADAEGFGEGREELRRERRAAGRGETIESTTVDTCTSTAKYSSTERERPERR